MKFTGPFIFKVADTNDGGRVLDASARLLSRALVSQSTSESWCIKYSVTSSVKQTPFVCVCVCLSVPPVFVRVGQYSAYRFTNHAWFSRCTCV
jgi:hypothetical protein